jgi:single stranded DNA-binding protein
MLAEGTAYNSVQCVGNLGFDPDVKFWEDGGCTTKIRIAIYGGKNKSTGEEYPSIWADVKASGKVAEYIAENFRKGDRIAVTQGALAFEKWKDKHTNDERSKLMVKAWEVEKIERRSPENNTGLDSYDDTF